MATNDPGHTTPRRGIRTPIRNAIKRSLSTARNAANTVWGRAKAQPTSNTIYAAAGALVALAVIIGAILMLRPESEPIDGFIARWNQVVEENDDALYDQLIAENVIETRPDAWLRGLRSVQDLHNQRKKLQPIEEPGDTNYIMVPVTPTLDDQDRATLAFHTESGTVRLALKQHGWSRKWRIIDVDAIATESDPEMPLVVVPISTQTEAADTPNTDQATPDNDLTTPLDTELKLRQVLEAWRRAWEQKEIDAYMAWYADYATIRRVTVVDGREIPETLDKAELRRRMQRLARRYGDIEIGIANLDVQGTHAQAELRFRQEFTAYNGDGPDAETIYQDVGTKWLKFVNDAGEWKIYEEDWRNYVNVPSFPLN